jgi:AcrR family transcriptional regulator
MPGLPPALAEALAAGGEGLPKRDRTRRQLLQAAIAVYMARGVTGATIQEIARVAGVANGTVYNHFETLDQIAYAVALWMAETLCRRITDSQQAVKEGAERMAIGNRRYLWLAEQSPAWAVMLLDVGAAAPEGLAQIQQYILADLRLGVKHKAFRIASEEAALDLINGTVAAGMRRIAMGLAPEGHATAVTTTVLMGLGMMEKQAAAVAARPLPDFPPLAAQESA